MPNWERPLPTGLILRPSLCCQAPDPRPVVIPTPISVPAPVRLRPSSQIISSADDICTAYASGRGSLKVRARWKIEKLARGQ